MSNTKTKILTEAKNQLNVKGLDNVTIRSISSKIGISSGNLAYHYKNIDSIIYALYISLIKETDNIVKEVMNNQIDIPFLYHLTEKNFELFWNYRFLLLDFTTIMRRDKKLKLHFRELLIFRQQQGHMMFQVMIDQGLMMPEKINGQYEYVLLGFNLIYSAWIPDAIVKNDHPNDGFIKEYTEIIIRMILPYLTEEGLNQYRKFKNKNNE